MNNYKFMWVSLEIGTNKSVSNPNRQLRLTAKDSGRRKGHALSSRVPNPMRFMRACLICHLGVRRRRRFSSFPLYFHIHLPPQCPNYSLDTEGGTKWGCHAKYQILQQLLIWYEYYDLGLH